MDDVLSVAFGYCRLLVLISSNVFRSNEEGEASKLNRQGWQAAGRNGTEKMKLLLFSICLFRFFFLGHMLFVSIVDMGGNDAVKEWMDADGMLNVWKSGRCGKAMVLWKFRKGYYGDAFLRFISSR